MNSANFTNTVNYGIYDPLTKTGKFSIRTDDIKSVNDLNQHFTWILNILRDGIETDICKKSLINITFHDGVSINLCITDYFTNLIMWHFYYAVGEPIDSHKLFFVENFTRNAIKSYIDTFLDKYRRVYDNIILNNIIDDALYKVKYVDEFNRFLCNTFNLEEFIYLMQDNKEFYDILHMDLNGISIEDIKKATIQKTNRAIEIIKECNHCLAEAFRTNEGIRPKQFKEFITNIGAKPDGQGSVYPVPINNSYINGGPRNIIEAMIESATGRVAQIIQYKNVAVSGDFARLLGLNNQDTFLHEDPHYVCDTRNFFMVTIKNEKQLIKLKNRYYRLYPNGVEKFLTVHDTHLIGKTIYLRSPSTCASKSRGEGICYRCYGDLAYSNKDINIGRFAAEVLSAILTQMLLSAKHILESSVRSLDWTEGFHQIFEIEYNTILVRDDIDIKGYKLILDPDEIYQNDEFDEHEYNEFIYQIEIQDPNGNTFKFETSNTGDSDSIYITPYLNDIANSNKQVNGKYVIDMETLKEPIFSFVIYNNELTALLKSITKTIDNTKIVSEHNRNSLIQELIDLTDKAGVGVDSVHLELLISNQLRSFEDSLECVDWTLENTPYTLLPLSKALSLNPSITVSMQYKLLSKALYNPLSYRKYKPSSMDLFYMEKPQNFIRNDNK